jgi:hypothetical protein
MIEETTRAGTYHVVHIGDDYHVLFEPDDLRNHFVSVSRFQDAERASAYAETEAMFQDDNLTPLGSEVFSLRKIDVKGIKVRQIKSLPDKKPDNSQPLSDLENEVLTDLPELMEKFPFGINVKEASEYYGEIESRLRVALNRLHDRNLIRLEQWPDDKSARAMPLSYQRPPIRFSQGQSSLLDAMERLADGDGIVQASLRMLCREGGVSGGSIVDMLNALEIKGAIKTISKGSGTTTSKYQVLARQEAA